MAPTSTPAKKQLCHMKVLSAHCYEDDISPFIGEHPEYLTLINNLGIMYENIANYFLKTKAFKVYKMKMSGAR